MKKILIRCSIFICLLLFTFPAFGGSKPSLKDGVLPAISLSVPQKPEHRKYLGLSGDGSFTIPQIKADVVVIEIYSMYCPYCQAEAPTVNALYRKIESDSRFKGKIKLIGIGVGNSEFEVDVFRKKYNIEFPLFPDADFAIHKMCGEVRTPYFIGVKIDQDGKHSIFYSELGSIKDPDSFLRLIVRASGL